MTKGVGKKRCAVFRKLSDSYKTVSLLIRKAKYTALNIVSLIIFSSK